MISLPAGMAGMPMLKFLIWTFAGSLIWNGMLAGAGYILGSRFSELDKYLGPLGIGVTVLAIGYWLFRVATWKPRERR